jgi:hypothetical protein
LPYSAKIQKIGIGSDGNADCVPEVGA